LTVHNVNFGNWFTIEWGWSAALHHRACGTGRQNFATQQNPNRGETITGWRAQDPAHFAANRGLKGGVLPTAERSL
jgi:hypothetical protein